VGGVKSSEPKLVKEQTLDGQQKPAKGIAIPEEINARNRSPRWAYAR
jgi:hypothetical protein